MKVYSAKSLKVNPKEAVSELKEQLNYENIKAITFFATYTYNPAEIIAEMNKNFPNIKVWGCSSMGEFTEKSIAINSIIAMAFTDEFLEDITIGVMENISQNVDTSSAICAVEEYFHIKSNELDYKRYFGFSYFDAFSQKEDVILDQLGDCTNIGCCGGTAADDLSFQHTVIYANGKYYTEGAILALLKVKPDVKFHFEMVQSMLPTGIKVVATKVDEEKRLIYELNGRPAGEMYSELMNIPLSEVPASFPEHSLALMIDGKPYLRALQFLGDDLEFRVGCAIKKGMELEIVKTGDIIANTKKSLDEIRKKYDSISGILAFDCGYRYMEAERNNVVKEYADLFNDFATVVGWFTFGESFIGHLNQTLTMLVIE